MMAIRVQSSLTSSTMCVERRTTLFWPSSLNRLRNRTRSAGSSPAVGSSTIISCRIAQQRHGDAKALPHAAGVAAELLLADVPQVRLPEQRLDDFFARPAIGDALQHREVIEQALRAHFRIHAKLLRQVTERLADLVLLADDVDVAEGDGPAVRLLQRGEHAHQRGLAGAIGAEQAVHPRRNREGHVLQGMHAVGVGLGYAANLQFQSCHDRYFSFVNTLSVPPRLSIICPFAASNSSTTLPPASWNLSGAVASSGAGDSLPG